MIGLSKYRNLECYMTVTSIMGVYCYTLISFCGESFLHLTLKYKQFPGKPAAEVSYKNKLTYRSVPVLSNTRVPQSNARAPDFNLQYKLTC